MKIDMISVLCVTIVATVIGLFGLGITYLINSSEDRIQERRNTNHFVQIEQCRERNGQVVLDEWGWFENCIFLPESGS